MDAQRLLEHIWRRLEGSPQGPGLLAPLIVFVMACDTFLTMLALPVLYLLFGKGPLAPAER